MADLSSFPKAKALQEPSYRDRVSPSDEEIDGQPEDAFRLATGNRQAHTLSIETTDFVNGIPYPLISGCDLEKRTGELVIVTPRWDFTIEGDDLAKLQLMIGDYRVRSIRAGFRETIKIRKITRGKEKEAW